MMIIIRRREGSYSWSSGRAQRPTLMLRCNAMSGERRSEERGEASAEEAGRGKREGRNNLIGIILEGTTRVSVQLLFWLALGQVSSFGKLAGWS